MARQISRIAERRIANISKQLIPTAPLDSHSPPVVTPAVTSSSQDNDSKIDRYRRIHGEVETREAEWIPATSNDDDSGRPFTDIIYEKAVGEGIAKITINRPERRNAFRPNTIKELIRAFNDARDDSFVGVIILTGSHPPLTILETRCTNMRHLYQIHSQLIKTGLAKDPVAVSRLLNFCATSPSGDLNYALLLFSHTPTPTAFMWNALLRALAKGPNPLSAISLFLHMLRSPTQPDRLTYPSLFAAYAHLCLPRDGAQLHGLVLKCGLDSDPYVHNSIISFYSTCGCMTEAYRLFDELECFDLVPYNSMIMGLARIGLTDESRALFDEMPLKNTVTWSSMISGYVRNGKNSEALGLFRQMQGQCVEPNAHTMVSLLAACAGLGALEQGEWVHACIEKSIAEPSLIVTNAIVDMYCKCGSLKKARKAFENAPVRGVSTWNTMIYGLAMHGRGVEAIRLFSDLESSGLSPDSVSFVSILAACGHCGLVDEARHYFSAMSEGYGIRPGVEHYGCMVDVLGRAGLIEEAECLIGGMPMRADAAMWGSLLSACRSYGEMGVGKAAAARILELDPWDSGGYVTLSNGHARNADFDDAVDARRAMKKRGVRKEPGCSVIEVNGGVHEFVAGGVLHPQARRICEALHGLLLNMRGTMGTDELTNVLFSRNC